MFAIGSPAHSQSLENPWGYSFNDIGVGKQIIFGAALNVGTDGSVAFVITRGDGGAGPLQSKIFWVKAKADGTDPTEPLWTSDWQARGESPSLDLCKRGDTPPVGVRFFGWVGLYIIGC